MRRHLYMIGNAHIDPVWLWRWPEGYQEVRATFASALDRMDEYPEFVFTMDQVVFLTWIEGHDPEMFARIRARVQEGRWELVGGMWVEPDCNLPSGESFARHFLYSQRYLQSRFGRIATVGLNADPFGHHAMLPQFLAKAGLDSYLFLRPQAHELALPTGAFWWSAPDGSRVLASRIPNEYCTPPLDVNYQVVKSVAQLPTGDRPMVCFYGVGNHGGGPTKANIESIRDLAGRDGFPSIGAATARSYVDAALADDDTGSYAGELQLHAVGCYSAMSEIKRNNRRSENALRSAEKWSTVAAGLAPLADPRPELAHGWHQVLFNQFHDILPGTALPSAYVDARDMHGEAMAIAARVGNRARQSISRQIDIPLVAGTVPVVLFNPHPAPVIETVEFEFGGLPQPWQICDEDGAPIPSQLVSSEARAGGRGRLAIAVDLEPLGYRTLRVSTAAPTVPALLDREDLVLENDHLRAVISAQTGWLSELRVSELGGADVVDDTRPHAVVLNDPTDTWSHGVRSYRDVVGQFRPVRVTRIADGPVRQAVRVVSTYGASRLVEEIRLDAHARHLEVRATIDWHEQLHALKLRIPTTLAEASATHEIPYGCIVRATDGAEVPSQSWVDLTGRHGQRGAGVAVLNDGKYSFDVAGTEAGVDLGIMAVRSPAFAWHDPARLDPDDLPHYQDQGIQQFTYRIVPHGGDFSAAEIPLWAMVLNEPPIPLLESAHTGPLPLRHSFAEAPAIVGHALVTVVKQAEDDPDVVVVRAYETAGAPALVDLRLAFLDRTVPIALSPHEIATVRIPRDPVRPVEVADLLERSLTDTSVSPVTGREPLAGEPEQ